MMRYLSLPIILSLTFAGTACSAQETPVKERAVETVLAAAAVSETSLYPDNAWRDVDPENLMVIDTDYGQIHIELYPEIAPKHVAQVKTLTRQKFYDYITFHRVIDDFMNQTGDPKGDGTGDSKLPDIEAEFEFRRSPEMSLTIVNERPINPRNPSAGSIGVGFYKALAVASQPASAAILTKDGKVRAFGLHCKGVTSMARSNDPNSANSQFFLMRGTADHLNAGYSIWGNTVYGHENLTKIKKGTVGETSGFIPDKMNKVQIAADIPEADRINIQVLDTDSSAFKNYLRTQKKSDGSYPDICDISVPSRLKP